MQKDPTTALEECIISILIAIARHSPTCANAVLKCERLVQTIVNRFTADNFELRSSMTKSVKLLKVSGNFPFYFIGSDFYISSQRIIPNVSFDFGKGFSSVGPEILFRVYKERVFSGYDLEFISKPFLH